MLDGFELGIIGAHFESGASTFEGVDPLGSYLTDTYPVLDAEHKARAFRRLVRSAVNYHRYPLMDQVRTIFRIELDPDMQRNLLVLLDQEDPDRIIEGRGAIPGR